MNGTSENVIKDDETKISFAEYQKFVNNYFNTDMKDKQRFGQAFINEFYDKKVVKSLDKIIDNKIFYCEDNSECIGLIIENQLLG